MAEIILAYDKSVRSYSKDGHLHVAKANISKATINDYKGSEIPRWKELGLDPNKIYKLFRDPKELEKGAHTFNGLPLLSRHPSGNETIPTANTPRPDLTVGATGTDAKYEHPYLTNSLVFWPQSQIDKIEADEEKELSSAYHYDPVLESGFYEGQPYDIRMTNIVGNHVAQVKEGRAGPDVLVADAKPTHVVGVTDDIFTLRNRKMAKSSKALSVKAHHVYGALHAYLAPKLAADAKVDLKSVLLGTTAKTYKTDKKIIIERLQKATHGKLAKDANLADVHGLLDRLDGEEKDDVVPGEMNVDPEENKDNPAVDDDGMCAKICAMLDGMVAPEMIEKIKAMCAPGGMDEEDTSNMLPMDDDMPMDEDMPMDDDMSEEEKMKKEKAAKDKAAKEKAAKDKAAKDKMMMDKAAKDKAAKDKEMSGMVDKQAMDAALERVRKDTTANTIKLMREIADAEKFVAPWVGAIAAQDSAADVYKVALDSLGVEIDGIHPSAYKSILSYQKKPGDRDSRQTTKRATAQDSKDKDDFLERFKDAGRLLKIAS